MVITGSPETPERRILYLGACKSMRLFVEKALGYGFWKAAADRVERWSQMPGNQRQRRVGGNASVLKYSGGELRPRSKK